MTIFIAGDKRVKTARLFLLVHTVVTQRSDIEGGGQEGDASLIFPD